MGTFHGELSLVRGALLDADKRPLLDDLAPHPHPVNRAGKAALAGGKWAVFAVGALALVVRGLSLWKPSLAGPLEQLLKVLAGL
jgi:hypothetical protein